MHKRIDLTKLGGIPITQYSLKWMQDSYRGALGAIASMVGDKAIIAGVEVVAGSATDGWICVDGEILPFVGGVVGADVVIIEESETRFYFDGLNNTCYYNKYATFGSPGNFAFSALKRPGLIPSKGIINFSGAIVDIPEGWALCDGTNGTPDLRGRFIVGYDPTDVDYDTIGEVGGEKKHTLLNSELPNITIPGQTGGDNNDHSNNQRFAGGDKGVGESGFFFNLNVNPGGGLAHENRPPYYTLAYIMKL